MLALRRGRAALAPALAVALAGSLAGCGLTLDFDPPDPQPGLDGGQPAIDAGAIDGGDRDAGDDDGGGGIDAGADAGVGPCEGRPDGTLCPLGEGVRAICLGGACAPSECGDGYPDLAAGEICDDGNALPLDGCQPDCRPSCENDSVCPALDECLLGACDGEGNCTHRLLDGDGDGFAPASAGACGDDCDDGAADVHPGASETCDGRDEDCDGLVDEGTLMRCLEDRDGDGYGVVVMRCECDPGGPAMEGDCWDSATDSLARLARPGQMNWFLMPHGGDPPPYDWNCDGVEERRFPDLATTCRRSGTMCVGGGWTSRVANCGERLAYTYCMADAFGGCARVEDLSDQPCR